MAVFVAASSRHEDSHGDLMLSSRLWTIWEYGAKRPGTVAIVVSKGVATWVLPAKATTTEKTTTYSGRSTMSRCKAIMQECYKKAGTMPITRMGTQVQLQTEKDKQMQAMTAAISDYYSRRITAMWKEICGIPAQLSAAPDKAGDKVVETQQKSDERLTDEPSKQPKITAESLASPPYAFRARKSLFPDPKHCKFFLSTAAQIFYLPKPKARGSAEKFSAKFALFTTMAMVATVPRNQPRQLDSVLPLASISVQPTKYGKISGIGLYIKYNPGSNTHLTTHSLPKFPRHECTNEYTTVGTSTAFRLSKIELQRLTGYGTVINRQEPYFRKQTVQYSTLNFLFGTVQAFLGKANRQEFFYVFRKPPPYRDKLQPVGPNFNSTAHIDRQELLFQKHTDQYSTDNFLSSTVRTIQEHQGTSTGRNFILKNSQ